MAVHQHKHFSRRLVDLDEEVTGFPSIRSTGGIPCYQGNGAVNHKVFEVGFGKGVVRGTSGVCRGSLTIASFNLERSQYR